MNRREFVKTCAALGVTVVIPADVLINSKADPATVIGSWEPVFMFPTYARADFAEILELTDYYIDEQKLADALTVGPLKVKDGQGYVECSADATLLWSSVELVDSEGRIWTTPDSKRWECRDLRGLHFEVDLKEGLGE